MPPPPEPLPPEPGPVGATPAVLPEIVEFETVSVPVVIRMPPPTLAAKFPITALSIMLSLPVVTLIPPPVPPLVMLFPEIVQPVNVMIELADVVLNPPPAKLAAVLLLITQRVKLRIIAVEVVEYPNAPPELVVELDVKLESVSVPLMVVDVLP